MVVISISILSKTGKILLARQFVPISRSRIDSLLTAFPKLLSTTTSSNAASTDSSQQQHTFIESEHIRYVYQLLDQLYVVLITTKASNIMEDLETLRLLTKIIPEYTGGQSEEHIQRNVYELLFALDECISIGHRESVTVSQVRTYTDMDSHEEKLQKIIQESKMNEAREQMKLKAEDIERKKMDDKRMQQQLGVRSAGRGSSGGFGSGYSQYDDSRDTYATSAFSPTLTSDKTPSSASVKASNAANNSKKTPPAQPKSKGMGMQLGKSKKTQEDFFSNIAKEDATVTSSAPMTTASAAAASENNTAAGNIAQGRDKVIVLVEEKVDVALDREGSVSKMEVKGVMSLQIFDPDHARIVVGTNGVLSEKSSGWVCRMHPQINKQLWASEGSLGLSDPSKPLPVGSESAREVLRWRKQINDESLVPISVNFWPNVEGGETVVNCEYTVNNTDLPLQNVQFTIPCADQPNVSSVTGDWKYDHRNKQLLWHIGDLTSDNLNGSIEFTVGTTDIDSFYPLQIHFSSPQTFSGLEVTSVTHAQQQSDIPFTPQLSLQADRYVVE